jgi:hypothetical protein
MDNNGERLRTVLLETVENQIAAGDPPETRATLARLVASGYSRQEAIEMIAVALTYEIWEVSKKQRPFNRTHYKTLLDDLK